jgi:hypothetical protein
MAAVEHSERQERVDSAERHEQAREEHTAAAVRHDAAALRWTEVGDPARAEFEHRNARIERDAADLEGDRAKFYRGAVS